MITRRQLLAVSGASLLWRGTSRAADTVPVHYHVDPPYFAYRKYLAPGADEFPEEAEAMAPAPRKPFSGETWFREVTGTVLDSEQLARGVPYWAARLDPAVGIDFYGNNGIAAADIDGDGVDEIYVSQPGGLPNKLFRWQDGKLMDISAASGLDLLDETSCALFLDLRRSGAQDAIVLLSSGPELFRNDGKGHFQHQPNAFRFARPPQGSFTGMAAADYDRDGYLDLYCCCYSFFQSEAQYRYPAPYHDARNGPPNFLFRNRLHDGGFFEDVTAAVGLHENNDRFSFAPAWCDYDGSGWPSLYVANDFGRNNLYRNLGGKFRDVAPEAGVEDIGPGMSACWFDVDQDGRADLYVSNMWTASGQRVVNAKAFRNGATPELREAYRRHTKGNSLYRNRGDGKFEDAGAQWNVERGYWAWSADACDLDNDGQPEIYVTCGMLTGPKTPDLMSFFWRQVVAKSGVTAQAVAAYEDGWNAINQFVREGYSWNGNEPNVFLARDGERYRDASAESGLDIIGDSRSFCWTDIDGDGCVDVLVKSRLGAQLRVFQNRRGQARERIAFDLEGVKSNPDAIGAKVEVDGQTKWLSAGSGYLGQHSKRLFFGLPKGGPARQVRVTWPSGRVQTYTGLAAGRVHRLREGEPSREGQPFRPARAWTAQTVVADNLPRLRDTWFLEPIPLPEPRKGPGLLTLRAEDLREGDRAAAYSLFRRYLFEYRADLEAPLHLLLDEAGRARKIYAQEPPPEQVRRDLAAQPQPMPYPGRALRPLRRDFYKLGAALLWSGYGAQALPYLEAVVRQQPENAKTMTLIGRVHLQANRLAEADAILSRSLAIDESQAEAWNERGGVAAARNDYRTALAHYERALAIKGDLLYCLLNAGQAADRLGDFRRSEQFYARARQAHPASADAANGLGLAIAKQNRAAEAKPLLEEAIRLKPDFGAAINNLGVLYLQMGQVNDAVAAFRYGIRSAPKEELVYLNLARVYVQSGERDKARQVLEEMQAALPESELAKRALRQLTER